MAIQYHTLVIYNKTKKYGLLKKNSAVLLIIESMVCLYCYPWSCSLLHI